MRTYTDHFIDGEWRRSTGDGFIEVENPFTQETFARIPAGSAKDAAEAVVSAQAAFDGWAALDLEQRIGYLRRVGELLREQRDELVEITIDELGAPRAAAAAAQVDLPLEVIDWICDLAPTLELESRLDSVLVLREPVGVVACITPWNYPLHQVVVKVVAALVVGCTVVLKPSEVTPLSALRLAESFEAAGLPAGVFNLVLGTGPEVGEALASHPAVEMVSFTGSTRAGTRVAELAAPTVKRVSLELGGKSASIVLPSADLDAAVKATVASSFENSGQACSALTRLLVPQEMLTRVEDIAAVQASLYAIGDPRDERTVLGPLVNATQRDRVRGMIARAVEAGARVVIGGESPIGELPETGYFVSPTVLTGVRPDTEISCEEVFGPVLVIMGYDTVDEAVRIANSTDYGLSGAVWAGTRDEAIGVARRLRTGQVIVNGGRWNFLAPFGGYKHSGLGRESGRYGLEEFLETKALRL